MRKRASGTSRRAVMAAMSFCAFFSLNEGRASRSPSARVKMSGKRATSPRSIKRSMILGPSPSMSKACLPAKCWSLRRWIAPELRSTQRCAASPGMRSMAPHSGIDFGNTNFFSFPVRNSVSTVTISGITSPAFCRMTVSPTRTSSRVISSSLCRVARETVEPSTTTGRMIATGVITPVLPTCRMMFSTTVVACSAGNL